jgi:hypothetical protein
MRPQEGVEHSYAFTLGPYPPSCTLARLCGILLNGGGFPKTTRVLGKARINREAGRNQKPENAKGSRDGQEKPGDTA